VHRVPDRARPQQRQRWRAAREPLQRRSEANERALAFAGGSGVVPMVSMLRHAIGTGNPDALRVVAVAKSLR